MSASNPLNNIARIPAIAKHAGVSTATVDRVLNQRSNVREATRQRVLQAKAAIENGIPQVELDRPWRLKVILPKDAGPSTDFLAACLQEVGKLGNATIVCEFTHKMEPVQLARKLRACHGQGIDAVAFQALEDPRVVAAVADLAAANIPAIGLMSGLERAATVGHVGINNRAAGRSAGYLMGRMTRTPGAILIVTGGDLYRAHEDREIGFRAVLRKDFSHVSIAASLSGHDDIDATFDLVKDALTRYPDLVGIYNVGGGNEGIARVLTETQTADEITFIGHNLTQKTNSYLLDGLMDAVVHQNLKLIAEQTVNTLITHLSGRKIESTIIPIEIITRENTEGVLFG